MDNNLVIWELGNIGINKYAFLTYQIKAPTSLAEDGFAYWNLTFDSTKKLSEFEKHLMQTFNYTNESHLEFDLLIQQREEFPWPEPRSAQPNRTYNFSLKVTNIGDTIADNWNVKIFVPTECSIINAISGTINSTENSITWLINNLNVKENTLLNFTLNCTSVGRKLFEVKAFRDTRNSCLLYTSDAADE